MCAPSVTCIVTLLMEPRQHLQHREEALVTAFTALDGTRVEVTIGARSRRSVT
jgi:hypothetical protein